MVTIGLLLIDLFLLYFYLLRIVDYCYATDELNGRRNSSAGINYKVAGHGEIAEIQNQYGG